MKRWLHKQAIIFTLGLLDNYKKYRSTPDDIVEALNKVTNFLESKLYI